MCIRLNNAVEYVPDATMVNQKYMCLNSEFLTLYIQVQIHMIVKDMIIDTIWCHTSYHNNSQYMVDSE